MERLSIIKTIGEEFLTSNIENGEFSYAQVIDRKLTGHYKLDIRFYDKESQVAVLVETKQKFSKSDKRQLFDYVKLEQEFSPRTKIVAILANTTDDNIRVWKIIGNIEDELSDRKLKSFAEYIDCFKAKNINDKTAVLENTSKLNRLLHNNGIPEKLRSQFVGTCLLALKNNLNYKGLSTSQIIAGIKEVLEKLLEGNLDKADKLVILHQNILQNQSVVKIKADNFEKILYYIETNIVPYINEASHEGQDILSYFFTTFNKYVAREDKNQAFTPNHIAHFMAKVAGIYRTSRVLDPTCGSGTFLVQAMSQALKQCETEEERRAVKKEQIFGIEFDNNVYGLATTNMLIHGDGNSNIRCGNCFDNGDWIKNANADVVLMNPPYNASKNQVEDKFASSWGKTSTDPSKGLFFVEFVADKVGKGRLLTLLPMACAIQTKGVIGGFKRKMLSKHTLDAVFSFPAEMFYPGANAVACCMVFELGKPHKADHETFFGYFKDDGFEKRKGVGRVDVRNKWENIENEWLDLYKHRSTVAGKSVNRHVEASEEWCAEAYMETDYSKLCDEDFIRKMRDYAAFLVSCSNPSNVFSFTNQPLSANKLELNTKEWQWFKVGNLFKLEKCKCSNATELLEEGNEITYIGAKKNDNGIMNYVRRNDELVTKGHCIVFIGDGQGSVGYCTYQPIDFIGSTTLIAGYNQNINVYNALFVVGVLDQERYRYSFGRKYKKDVIKDSLIKLPAIPNAKGEYEPDWQWMEDYIKGLPYSSSL